MEVAINQDEDVLGEAAEGPLEWLGVSTARYRRSETHEVPGVMGMFLTAVCEKEVESRAGPPPLA